MPISTMRPMSNAFGWFITNDLPENSSYLRKDGSIGPTTLDHNQEYAYWKTEQEAKDFLALQQDLTTDP